MTSIRKPRRRGRRVEPHEKVLKELAADDREQFSLEKHLQGCFAGYQTTVEKKGKAEIGEGTYFAFEAIWGIVAANNLNVQAGERSATNPDWTLPPHTPVEVPWMWLFFLAEAWERFSRNDLPIGKALGLEGSKGQRQKHKSMIGLLNERAIARWIRERSLKHRADGHRSYVLLSQQDASDEFGKSFAVIRKIWNRHGRAVRMEHPK